MKKILLSTIFVLLSNFVFCQISIPWMTDGINLTGGTGTEFLGTTSADPIIFKTKNVEQMNLSVTGELNIGIPSSVGTKLALKNGWSDWVQFHCDNGIIGSQRRWSIHNPQDQDAMTFYYVDDAGNPSFNIFSMFNDGKVSIGDVTKPGNYRLYVQDGILTEKLKVAIKSTNEWSDYVFNSDYKLKSLDEVGNFIKKYKHLPDVPSADEMVNSGLDVATMDAKLLQKIEELTLYLLEQKKENEELKKRIVKLENN
jgi:hypothetical protein